MQLLFLFSIICIISVRAACPSLGSSEQYGVLGATTVSNTGATLIEGSVGVSPGTAIVGFPPGSATGSLDTGAVSGHESATLLFNNLLAMTCENLTDNLGGQTLLPGVYCVTAADLTGTLTLDGDGSTTGVWVFNIGSTLTGAADALVDLVNGSMPCNVFWTVGSSATFGGGSFVGTVIAAQSITMTTDSSLTGHAFALNAAVTLDTNSIMSCSCNEMEAPGFVQPTSGPQVSTPQVSSPAGSSPQASGPQVSTPQVSSPAGSSPQASGPQVSTPQASGPGISPSRTPTTKSSSVGRVFVPIYLVALSAALYIL